MVLNNDLAFYGLNPKNNFKNFKPETIGQTKALTELKLIADQSAEMINRNGSLRHGKMINLYGTDDIAKNHLVEAFAQKVIDKIRVDVKEKLAIIKNRRSLETLGFVAVDPVNPSILIAENLFNELNDVEDVDLEDKAHLIVALQRAEMNRKLFLTTTNFPLLELFKKVGGHIPNIGIYEYCVSANNRH